MGQAMTETVLEGWTIFFNPADAPGRYVVRRWETRGGEVIPCEAFHGPSLEVVRLAIPQDRYRIPRLPDDEPAVVEVWI